jgi:hypothetical protein
VRRLATTLQLRAPAGVGAGDRSTDREMAGVTQQFWVPVGCTALDGGHGTAVHGSTLHLDDGAGVAPASPRMEEGGALGQRRSELAPFIPACMRQEGTAPFSQCRRDGWRHRGRQAGPSSYYFSDLNKP